MTIYRRIYFSISFDIDGRETACLELRRAFSLGRSSVARMQRSGIRGKISSCRFLDFAAFPLGYFVITGNASRPCFSQYVFNSTQSRKSIGTEEGYFCMEDTDRVAGRRRKSEENRSKKTDPG